MEIGSIAVMCVGMLLVGMVIVRFWKLKNVVVTKYYEGKVVFESMERYGEFKRAIGKDCVTWYKADVLSSDPPIVVQFQAAVTPEGQFPYGEETIHSKVEFDWCIALLTVGSILAAVGLLFYLATQLSL